MKLIFPAIGVLAALAGVVIAAARHDWPTLGWALSSGAWACSLLFRNLDQMAEEAS